MFYQSIKLITKVRNEQLLNDPIRTFSKPAHLAEQVSYDCIDSRVEAGDNMTSLVLLRGKKAEQKSQRAQLTPKETKVCNELASFLAEPIILPPVSTGNAA